MQYSIFESLLEPVFVIDENLSIIYVNDTAAELCGIKAHRIKQGTALSDCIYSSPDIVEGPIHDINKPTPFKEITYRGKKGKEGFAMVSIQKDEESDNWVIYFRESTLEMGLQSKFEIADRTRKEQSVRLEAAKRDPLTKIFNKGSFLEFFERRFNDANKFNFKFCLIVFDLDNFKKLNDTWGHQAGDYVLETLAQEVSSDLVRESDFFARFGGEEFVIVLDRCALKEAAIIGERICRHIENFKFTYKGKELPVTISLGVGEFHPSFKDNETFFEYVDKASYTAKKNGKNQISVAPPIQSDN